MHDEAAMSNAAVEHASPPPPAQSGLTDEEAGQLERFSKGREKIQHDLGLLEARPTIDAFADFNAEVDERSMESIKLVWSSLDEQRAQCQVWREERDRIEEQTVQFDSADMQSLRKLAKAASERNMSPSDTDVVEVALDTLVALEKLRNHLEGRHSALNVLQARLDWESARRDFYINYAAVADEVDAFVSTKARWSPSIYTASSSGSSHTVESHSEQRSRETSATDDGHTENAAWAEPSRRSAKSTRSRFLLAEILSFEGQRILSRIDDVRQRMAPQTGQNLDAVIAFLKVPDGFLDEQDRIDGLADDLHSRAAFTRELINQWEKADHVYHHLLSLHKDARNLASEAGKAASDEPTLDHVEELEARFQEVRARLDQVAEPQGVRKLLSTHDGSIIRVAFNSSSSLNSPEHAHWSDQNGCSASAQASLSKELSATAKRVKQAQNAVARIRQLLDQLRKTHELRGAVIKGATECRAVSAKLEQALAMHFASEQPSSWQEVMDDGIAMVRSLTQEQRDARLVNATATVGDARTAFQGLHDTIASMAQQLRDASLACQSSGARAELYHDAVTDALQTWQESTQHTQGRLDSAEHLLEVLDLLHKVQQALTLGHNLMHSGSQLAADDVQRYHWASVVVGKQANRWHTNESDENRFLDGRSTLVASHGDAMQHIAKALEEASRLTDVFRDRARLGHVSSDASSDALRMLSESHEKTTTAQNQLRDVFLWAEALHGQSQAVLDVHREFSRLHREASELKTELEHALSALNGSEVPRIPMADPNRTDLANESSSLTSASEKLDRQRAGLHDAISVFVASQDARIVPVGDAPAALENVTSWPTDSSDTSLLEGALKSSPDDAVRSFSHDMCLDLRHLQDNIDGLAAELMKRRHAALAQQVRSKDQPDANEVDSAQASATAHKEREGPFDVDEDRISPVPGSTEPEMSVYELQPGSDSTESTYSTQLAPPKTRQPFLRNSSSGDTIIDHGAEEEEATVSESISGGTTSESARPEAPSQPRSFPSVAVSRAVQACEHEISRRRKSYNKILNSATSRRLPKAAFLAELRHRRIDAESALAQRLETLHMVIAQISRPEPVAENFNPTQYNEREQVQTAEQERSRVSTAVDELLNEFDAAIEAEGGLTLLVAQSAEKPKRKSITIPFSHSADFPEVSPHRRRSAVEIPASYTTDAIFERNRSASIAFLSRLTPSKKGLDKDQSPTHHLADSIAGLQARLAPGEVEEQTVPRDGSLQARKLLDLPNSASFEALATSHEALELEVFQLHKEHPLHADVGVLEKSCRRRKEHLARYSLLATFAQKAAIGEAAVSRLLQVLDEASASPSRTSTRSTTPRKLAGSRPSSSMSGRAGELHNPAETLQIAGQSPSLLKQQIERQVAELESLIEAASEAASLIMDDVRVRDRVGQLNVSFVDVSELSREALEPSFTRSESVLSRSTTDSCLSRSSSPALSRLGSPRLTEDLPRLGSVLRSSRLPRTPRLSSTPTDPPSSTKQARRPRVSSLASIPPPSATAQRALARSLAASAGGGQGPLTTSSPSPSPAPTPTGSRIHARRRASLNTPVQTPDPKTPLRSRGHLPAIQQSPGTPSALPSRPMVSSQSMAHIATPSSLARAPGSRLPLRSPSVSSVRSVSGQPSSLQSTPRRPNRYRANPKSKLDIAVGKIVNRMPVPVQIVHASKAPGARAADDWRDESGKYWVGHPDPKLCFCRILRSRTIMVRVGGGWQELTRYIIQHYDLAASVALGESSSPTQAKTSPVQAHHRSNDLPWISAASLSVDSPQYVPTQTPGAANMTPSHSSGSSRRLASAAASIGQDISSPILISPQGSPETHHRIRDTPTRRNFDSNRATTPTRSSHSLQGRHRLDSLGSMIDHEATPTRGLGRSLRAEGDPAAWPQVPFQLKAPEADSSSSRDPRHARRVSSDAWRGPMRADPLATKSSFTPHRVVSAQNGTPSSADPKQDGYGGMLPMFFRKEGLNEMEKPVRRSISGSGKESGQAKRRASQGGAVH